MVNSVSVSVCWASRRSSDSIKASRFHHDLVFGLEDLLPLPPLLALQLLDLLLDFVLLFKVIACRACRRSALICSLVSRQRLLSAKHHVVGPLLQLLPRVVEVFAVLLQRSADCRLGVALGFRVETCLTPHREIAFDRRDRARTAKSFSIVSGSRERRHRRSQRIADAPRAHRSRSASA